MKQAKTISKPQPLESVSETEESQILLPKANPLQTEISPSKKGSEFFGVRSYVHTFYEAMAMDNPHGYEDIENPFGYIMPVRKRRKQILCWRILFGSGLFILCVGLVALLVGFLVPKRKEIVDSQEDIEIIDRYDQAFNQDLDTCKVVGIILFCTGGILVTVVLLALTVLWKSKRDDPLSLEELPLTTKEIDQIPNTPMDVKVPATEEVSAVQPKRVDPDEVVMTNAGLCKIP
ncbi:neurensin-1-like isoform X2 [Parasteatoda tepidariorum]